jgi:putative aminopeptidase FrvX
VPAPKSLPGSGVLIAMLDPTAELSGLAAELKRTAEQNGINASADASAALIPRGYVAAPAMPRRAVHLAVAAAWANTPAETVDGNDVEQLVALLEAYLQGSPQKTSLATAEALPAPKTPERPKSAPAPAAVLKQVIETYGSSGGHELAVREAIAALLPAWAKTETDDAGNLILHWGAQKKAGGILVVAHQDEIGWEVRSILADGRLDLEPKGGGTPAFFMGHPVLVHTANGIRPGVLELPDGWDQAGFQWPRAPRIAYRVDVGAHSAEQVAQLGIKVGDFATVAKRYRQMLGTRVSARAFDDRVGCAALVAAAWALGPQLASDRDVTFVWSTGEELGLLGAAAMAKRLAAEGRAPEYVFAVDTFVSSDSPLESPRFADAKLGHGFVVRAVDNSNIAPRKLVQKVIATAKSGGIAAQYGVTGGGNDGATFTMYGGTDVALGWPLRAAHSPGEVIDTRDLDALAHILAAVARSW